VRRLEVRSSRNDFDVRRLDISSSRNDFDACRLNIMKQQKWFRRVKIRHSKRWKWFRQMQIRHYDAAKMIPTRADCISDRLNIQSTCGKNISSNYTLTIQNIDSHTTINLNGVWTQIVPISTNTIIN